MKNHIFKLLESIEYFYVVAVVLSFCNPSPKLIWLNINSGSLPLLISSSVRLEPFQWENLSSIIAISRFFFVSTRLPFFLLYFHFISTFLILILSGRQFIFPFSDSALASGLSVLEQQSPLPKTYTGLWRLQRISQVFHFQFSLTVCLRSFTFWGGIPAPVCLHFLLPLLCWKESSFSLSLSPCLLPDSLFTSPVEQSFFLREQKDLFFFISGISQARPGKSELSVWACIQQWREGNMGSCHWSGMKTTYGRVPKSSRSLLLLSSCQSVVISCLI